MPYNNVWQNAPSFTLLEAAFLVCNDTDPKYLKCEALPADVRHIFRRLIFESDHHIQLRSAKGAWIAVKNAPLGEIDMNDYRDHRIRRVKLMAWCDKNGLSPSVLYGSKRDNTKKLLSIIGLFAETMADQNPNNLRRNEKVILGDVGSGITKLLLDKISSVRDKSNSNLRGYGQTTLIQTIKKGLQEFDKNIK